MKTNRERILEAFDAHIGEILDTHKLAEEAGVPYKQVVPIISHYFYHRLDPPIGKKREILPPDGFSEPISAKRSLFNMPEDISFKTATTHASSRQRFSDEKEEDSGSR